MAEASDRELFEQQFEGKTRHLVGVVAFAAVLLSGMPPAARAAETIIPGDGWSGPEFRYEDHGDGTFTDLNTGLMWEKKVRGGDGKTVLENPHGVGAVASVYQAVEWIKKLNESRYAGYDDWRLPDVRELQLLIDFSLIGYALDQPGFESDGKRFPGMSRIPGPVYPSYHWSLTKHSRIPGAFWAVSFGSAWTFPFNRSEATPVRAVRGGAGPFPPLPKIQLNKAVARNVTEPPKVDTSVIGGVLPGDGQSGPALLYKDNGDGTFTDVNTGLMWEIKVPGGDGQTCLENLHGVDAVCSVDQAFEWVEKLNEAEFAGYTDWCMPNVAWLQTLQNPATCDGGPGGGTCPKPSIGAYSGPGEVGSGMYHTSTIGIRVPKGYIWALNFFSGMKLNLHRNDRFRVRAVRCNWEQPPDLSHIEFRTPK